MKKLEVVSLAISLVGILASVAEVLVDGKIRQIEIDEAVKEALKQN